MGTSVELATQLIRFARAPAGPAPTAAREPVLFAGLFEIWKWAAHYVPPDVARHLPAGETASTLSAAALLFVNRSSFAPDANHYAVLGLSPDTGAITDALVRRHYRALIRLAHPDVGVQGLPANAASRVNRAFAVLGNETERRRYDEKLQLQQEVLVPAAPRRPAAASTPAYAVRTSGAAAAAVKAPGGAERALAWWAAFSTQWSRQVRSVLLALAVLLPGALAYLTWKGTNARSAETIVARAPQPAAPREASGEDALVAAADRTDAVTATPGKLAASGVDAGADEGASQSAEEAGRAAAQVQAQAQARAQKQAEEQAQARVQEQARALAQARAEQEALERARLQAEAEAAEQARLAAAAAAEQAQAREEAQLAEQAQRAEMARAEEQARAEEIARAEERARAQAEALEQQRLAALALAEAEAAAKAEAEALAQAEAEAEAQAKVEAEALAQAEAEAQAKAEAEALAQAEAEAAAKAQAEAEAEAQAQAQARAQEEAQAQAQAQAEAKAQAQAAAASAAQAVAWTVDQAAAKRYLDDIAVALRNANDAQRLNTYLTSLKVNGSLLQPVLRLQAKHPQLLVQHSGWAGVPRGERLGLHGTLSLRDAAAGAQAQLHTYRLHAEFEATSQGTMLNALNLVAVQ